MEPFRSILSVIWREACQHIEVEQAAGSFATMLHRHIPFEQMVFQRLDAEHHRVVTVAVVPAAGNQPPTRQCSEREWKRLTSWFEQDGAVHRASAGNMPGVLKPFLLVGAGSDVLIAPLIASAAPVGLVLMLSEPRRRFDEKHVEMLTALQEPLAVALENDRRLHELAALREAAEADKRSLLNRLGRTEIADTIVGDDSGLQQVMERVRLVCRSDVPVLILGETGTGKELIARAIHVRSDRNTGPFIRVNCGAIPPELIDSHLFGHERGSFTGASDSRPGWFERASGGTLFLDEIGELPLGAQVRFLRVLQDGIVERVGGGQSLHVDVRIAAATHRDLYSMVREGQFREDLWYRINVFPILLPPLRERIKDIAPLAKHFARRAATRFGLAPVEPTDLNIQQLEVYSWPGNIRELAAVIDRAAILGEGHTLEVATALGFGERSSTSTVAGAGFAPASDRPLSAHGDLAAHTPPANSPQEFPSLDQAMCSHIQQALKMTRGRIEGPYGAATLLRINPHTLRARMRKFRIDWSAFREGVKV